MRVFGWSRAELYSHSPFELACHWAVLEFEAKAQRKSQMQQQHQSAVATRR